MTLPTDVRSSATKVAANQGALDNALRDAYLHTLHGRVQDPERLHAAAVWGAGFLMLDQRDKVAAIIQTAMNLLQCEHGAITLVGEEAVVLVGVNAPAQITYSVDDSFCQHVVDGQPFQVNSATINSLVCKLPSLDAVGIRSYLGVPVTFQDFVVGSLCVYDLAEREWTPTDVRVLASLAMTVQQVIG